MAGLTAPRPLAAEDVRDSFDCGRASLDDWFRHHAWRNHVGGVSRVTVVCDQSTREVAAYASLSAASIRRAHLIKADQRNRPDPIPAILLGQLAVDRRYQGRGIGRDLLRHALGTSVRLSMDIGCLCVLTHPLDDPVRAFYAGFGFVDLPGDPLRSMAVRIADLKASGF